MQKRKVPSKKALEHLKKRKILRDELWPNITEEMLWVRNRDDGFTTIPRTLTYIMEIMKDLHTGTDLSRTYLALWCRVWDECFVTITNCDEIALESGFSRQRAVHAWKRRIDKLQELGFIDVKPGKSGSYNHILILNPYIVIKSLKENGANISDKIYYAFYDRAVEIKAIT